MKTLKFAVLLIIISIGALSANGQTVLAKGSSKMTIETSKAEQIKIACSQIKAHTESSVIIWAQGNQQGDKITYLVTYTEKTYTLLRSEPGTPERETTLFTSSRVSDVREYLKAELKTEL